MVSAAPSRVSAGGTELGEYVRALLLALARDEALGRRAPRLTEAGQATWQRFRGRLRGADLFRLLVEDAAVVHAIPFDAARTRVPFDLDGLDDSVVDAVLAELPSSSLTAAPAAYLEEQARRLGINTRLARSELHQVKPHHKVLELPGTGGLLAHHLVTTRDGLTLQQNVTIAGDGWRELTLAGLAALDVAAPHTDFIVAAAAADLTEPGHSLRQQSFDFVVGRRPAKGGKLQIDDQLALWFHGAKIVLV